MENIVDKILSTMETMSLEVSIITKEMGIMRREMQKIAKENDDLLKQNRDLKDKVSEFMENAAKKEKRNNVVIIGMHTTTENTNMLKNIIDELVKTKIGIEINIKSVKKMGPKIILVELENENDKQELMRNKFKLKNYGECKIYICNDLTKEEQYIQRQIRMLKFREARKGNHVESGYQKLIINDVVWRWDRTYGALKKCDGPYKRCAIPNQLQDETKKTNGQIELIKLPLPQDQQDNIKVEDNDDILEWFRNNKT